MTDNQDKDFDYDGPNANWVSDDELQAAMAMEETVFGRDLSSGASKKLAKRLFDENAAAAAQSIIKTAIHGTTEKVRFDAAKYVLDRALGPVATPFDRADDPEAPLESAMNELMGNTKGRGSDHPG
jgi:hypothetical protein